jgi:hypothetical protein
MPLYPPWFDWQVLGVIRLSTRLYYYQIEMFRFVWTDKLFILSYWNGWFYCNRQVHNLSYKCSSKSFTLATWHGSLYLHTQCQVTYHTQVTRAHGRNTFNLICIFGLAMSIPLLVYNRAHTLTHAPGSSRCNARLHVLLGISRDTQPYYACVHCIHTCIVIS